MVGTYPFRNAQSIRSMAKAMSRKFIGLEVITDQKSVPTLWDKQTGTCVNNESAEILRMMATVLRPLGKRAELDLYPEALQQEIDEWNAPVSWDKTLCTLSVFV